MPASEQNWAHSQMWYARPGGEWKEGLPIGNGVLGGMLCGGELEDRLALNHEWLWRGNGRGRDIEPVWQKLDDIRQLFFEGKTLEAGTLAAETFGGGGGKGRKKDVPKRVDPYQPAGDLMVRWQADQAGDYRRQLDLDRAVASVCCDAGPARISREYLAHAELPVLAIRLRCDGEPVTAMLALDRVEDPDCTLDPYTEGNVFGLRGKFPEGIRFAIEARAIADGEIAPGEPGSLQVKAGETLVLLTIAVDHDDNDPTDACRAQLDSAATDWDELLGAHTDAHRALYRRVRLEIGGEAHEDEPTDERLAKMREGRADEALLALYANYGRYLLISSSRAGEVPVNLQGIWNEQLDPPWQCDLHHDINLEMNYWPAEVCGLADCLDPLFDHIDRFRPHGREVARKLYNCRGFLMPIQTDPWGRATPESNCWDVWIGAAAWLSQHLWWRWEYARDEQFLAERAYPVLKEIAAFYEDYLVTDPRNGHLVPVPSQSPENKFVGGTAPVSLCVAAAMDIELIVDVLTHAIEASEAIGVDEALRGTWRGILEKLPPLQIGKHGQLQEWFEDYEEAEPGHRHISHLYAMFPGDTITLENAPELTASARVSLERRLAAEGGHTGWSRAWTVCCWARLRAGDNARYHMQHLVTDFATDTLLDLHPPRIFQIDGNLGGCAGLFEMLLQSHNGIIRVLPALPEAWADGSVAGLRARDGFTVDVDWSGGQASEVRIASQLARPCAVLATQPPAKITCDDQPVEFSTDDDGTVRFDTDKGKSYILSW